MYISIVICFLFIIFGINLAQVLKVCLNHFVTSDMKFAFKEGSDHKVLLWAALDFSDPDKIDGEVR